MYWFLKIRHQNTEKTFSIALREPEAECFRGVLIRSGYAPDDVRIIYAETLEEGVNGNDVCKKIL